MSRIRLLPDQLISQIAAGEVVERPASVIKELLENALDAGASAIEIELEAGGKRRLRVVDDGCGMDRDDALLAFDRHATSKIGSFEDLERVATLGFRGEALASIAAVARVELVTAVAAGEGQRVRIEGGRVRSAEPIARARGTTVEVRSLFFNVPARRRFLKTPATELRRALEVVQGYALARPEVGFRVAHQGRALLEAPAAAADAAGSRSRIAHLFGRELAERLVELPAGGGSERLAIHGFVGDPETARPRRIFTFVNRRLLRDRALAATFYRAVREEWRHEDFPALFLFLDLPPEEVDVNVHPQKSEVRFRDPRLLDRVFAALRDGLAAARGEEEAPLEPLAGSPTAPLAWQGLGERGETAYPLPGETAPGWEVRDGPAAEAPGGFPAGYPSGSAGYPDAAAGRLATPSITPAARASIPLSGRSGVSRPFRLLGQYKGTLILLEGPDGLYLIDQHVAHERLLYERLRRAMTSDRPASQRLLTPLLLELAPAEALELRERSAQLEAAGFALTELSGGTLGLTAVPAVLSAEEGERLVLSLARAGDGEGGGEEGALARELLEALAASMACRAAVKMHHPLNAEEMEALVAELFAAEQPYACPHGRPIVLKMEDRDLEKRFKRR